mmetsp:Transcript_5612/g.14232  ORF Transcript_5612/g.14232 Transcript_5612/m.14232 type:complete len:185 (+) Transcript_5612:665-1219(+)|eukprot:CAMPEP_0197574416 /NCGR_PEP_ID=MMETSP1326-20131121/148_1 /TAXON_ID=1155430 /ORGANISM="Genus nov. species nov., Strain RCC2288" /LENGTH=184 /DNA_ID=CAMNT_0043136981 /DNA_START=645 /DNA_END=1199 /DNA_ORIENTATION=+
MGAESPTAEAIDSSTTLQSPVVLARTGRDKQRYREEGQRLVAGCIPVRACADGSRGVEVLMVNSKHGDGLIFPKGGWETDETAEEAAARESMEEAGVRGDLQELGEFEFSSKSRKKEGKKGPQASCIAAVFVMQVTEEMDVWPEQAERSRTWCHPSYAIANCRHEWMQDALRQWGRRFQPELQL